MRGMIVVYSCPRSPRGHPGRDTDDARPAARVGLDTRAARPLLRLAPPVRRGLRRAVRASAAHRTRR